MPSALIWIVAAIAILLLIVLARWQRYTQTLPSGLEFHPIQASDSPNLASATQKLLDLGFDSPQDYRVEAERGRPLYSSSRLLYHPQHRCFAQLIPLRSRPSLDCAFSSFLTNHWTLRTSNRSATLLEQLSRPGQLIWDSFPTAPLDRLLAQHLEDRERLAQTEGTEPVAEPTVDLLWTKAKEEALRRKQVMKRQNSTLAWVKGIGIRLRSRKR